MREILFRGIRKDTHELVYGFYGEYFNGKKNIPCISIVDTHAISGSFCYEVIPETVGQFTGLTDRNGEKIFEGDIIAYRKGCLAVSFDFASFGFLFEGYNGEEGYSHVIPFNDYENGIYIDRKTYQIDYEIVGNVLDNSDLLKGE